MVWDTHSKVEDYAKAQIVSPCSTPQPKLLQNISLKSIIIVCIIPQTDPNQTSVVHES